MSFKGFIFGILLCLIETIFYIHFKKQNKLELQKYTLDIILSSITSIVITLIIIMLIQN